MPTMKVSGWMVAALAAVFAAAAPPCGAQCQLPTWSPLDPLAIDLYGPGVTTDGTFAWSVGGRSFSTGGVVGNFEVYDGSTWSSLAPLPTATATTLAVYWQPTDSIYAFGGQNPIGGAALVVLQVYSVVAGTWSTGPPLPEGRDQMGGGALGGAIHLVGGYPDGNIANARTTNWRFNPAAGTYTPRAPLPEGVGGPASAVSGDTLYIIGGRNGTSNQKSTVFAYDVVADSWSSRAPLPVAVNGAVAVAVPAPGSDPCAGDIIVAGGGTPFFRSPTSVDPVKGTGATRTTSAVQIYDAATDSWSSGPDLGQPRSFAGAAAIGDMLLIAGGYDGDTTATVEGLIAPVPVELLGFTVE